jgi:hypothetical protein
MVMFRKWVVCSVVGEFFAYLLKLDYKSTLCQGNFIQISL